MNVSLSISAARRRWLEDNAADRLASAIESCEFVRTFPTGCKLVHVESGRADCLRAVLPSALREQTALTISNAKPWAMEYREDAPELALA